MLSEKKGFPEDGEIVLCTVTRVDKHSVFANLDEYGRSGLIHISEVSPGRIRNIRDFVREGKKVVCKVLKVDEAKGHIDLSLRRVNLAQKKEKLSHIKQEQTAEKIIEIVANKLKKDKNDLYKQISESVLKSYDSLFASFQAIVNNETTFDELGLDKEISKDLTQAIKQRIKPLEVEVRARLKLSSPASDGVNIVKQALKKALEASQDVKIKYLGSGKYGVVATAQNYKKANEFIEKALNQAVSHIKANGGEGSFRK
jgi:translation initiation factor 2 subunit 1